VVGLAPAPATVNEELVRAIAAWQAERNEAQDGKIGNITTRSLVLELIAEGQRRDAVCLIVDSYGLLHSLALQDIQVGFGQDCCGTAADPADAVTFGGVCGGGGRVRVCVCQNRFPPAIDYNHWVRIVGHEMVHVPQCARAVAGNADADEFEAFFWEACGEGRAPRLTAAQRVGHANHALGLFAALPAADRTAARVGMRDRLNNLVTNNGAGVC
jgi:hypothetical protein